LVIKSPTWRD